MRAKKPAIDLSLLVESNNFGRPQRVALHPRPNDRMGLTAWLGKIVLVAKHVKVAKTIRTNLHLGHFVLGHFGDVASVLRQRTVRRVVDDAVVQDPFDVREEGLGAPISMLSDIKFDGAEIHEEENFLTVIREDDAVDRLVKGRIRVLFEGLKCMLQ